MKKIFTILILCAAFVTIGTSVEAKTNRKSSGSTSTSKAIPLQFENGIAIAAGHTYAAPVPGGKITWYFNPNGRLKMTFKNQSGLGYWEQKDDTFQFYGEEYNFMGYGQISDNGKVIYILPTDGTEEFEINLVK